MITSAVPAPALRSLLDHLPPRSLAVDLLREGMPLGIGGPVVTANMLRVFSDRMGERSPPVFSLSASLLGKAMVQVGEVRDWRLTEATNEPAIILSVVVTWNREACQSLSRATLREEHLLEPALNCNVSFRPMPEITSLFMVAPWEAPSLKAR